MFHTSSTATITFSSFASGSSRSRMTCCDLVHASRYEVVASTTAGTSSTVSAPHSAALRSEVSMPATLLLTAVRSLLDSGNRQWSAFITE